MLKLQTLVKSVPGLALAALGCAALARHIDGSTPTPWCQGAGPTNRQLVAVAHRTREAVVRLEAGSGFATAFLVSHSGLAITAAHVLRSTGIRRAVSADRKAWPVRLIAVHPSLDLAVVKLEGRRNWPTLELGQATPALYEAVFAIGNSCNLFLGARYGRVLGLPERPRARRISGEIETDVPLAPGDSGGPLIDSQGRAIGVVVAVGYDGLGFSAFAVPIRTVSAWLDGVLTRSRGALRS